MTADRTQLGAPPRWSQIVGGDGGVRRADDFSPAAEAACRRFSAPAPARHGAERCSTPYVDIAVWLTSLKRCRIYYYCRDVIDIGILL